jgi:serine/threonine protein kinase
VANGADMDAKTVSGQTAEALALERGHADVELSLAKLKPGSEASSGVKAADFAEYKDYLLKRSDIQFNSITTLVQDTSEGTWLDSPVEVKVKRIKGVSKNFVEELDRWAKLNHPHVIKLYGFCKGNEAGSEPYFVYERPAYASMYDYIHSVGWDVDAVWGKLYQAALGFQYLHDRNIIHGRLSPYSIAVASNGVAKLQGFDGAADTRLSWWTAPEIVAGLPPSFESDVFVFGLVIVDTFGLWDMDSILAGNLSEKPEKMTPSQWHVITRMCAYEPRERLSASDVVRELQAFTKGYLPIEKLTPEEAMAVKWTRIGDAPIAQSLDQTTVADFLEDIAEMCTDSSTTDRLSRDIYDRLTDVLHQLETQDEAPAKDLVYRFGDIIRYFHMRLRSTRAVGSAQAARFAASRQGADNSFSTHRSLDAFMEETNLSRSSPIHNWREQWEVRRKQQQREMLERLGDLPTLLEGAETDKERQDALTYLRFELSKHPANYAASNAAGLTRARSSVASSFLAAPSNSSWFLPEYEVEFNKFDEFSRGAFGKVYRGTWKGSRVVVKKVKLRSKDDEATFLNEVEIWHKLFHPNVVQLFGACHVGRPFFVCEFASGGQLDKYLREKPKEVWEKLHEAALGLRYLHVKRVVHADLKCNNILIGSDGKAKLTDFGLSSLDVRLTNREPESELDNRSETPSVGAIRWKAPEVLRGEKSTFASDIYSFGMCVLEAVSGKYPWGYTMDMVVQFYVLEERKLPARPANCSEEVYGFVQQMCRFEPSKRLRMDQVVGALNKLRLASVSEAPSTEQTG